MEVIASGTDSESTTSFISVADLQAGSHLLTFKQNAASAGAYTNLGDRLLVAQNDKAVINVYRWHKEGVDQKMIVPEKLSTLCSSHDGVWVLGGTSGGRLYLWEVASGNLLFVSDAHYQGVSTCAFTQDDTCFVTGSADASIQVWRMSDILSPLANQDLIRASATLTQHTMAITSVHVGSGTAHSARLYTASLDQTLRIWDLATRELLTTFVLPAAINAIVVDAAERCVYVGTEAGSVHEVNLFRKDKIVQVIGGTGTIVSAGEAQGTIFAGHEQAITALAISLDGSCLISGSRDGQVLVWDVGSKQMVRQLKTLPSTVTLLFTLIKPATDNVQPKAATASLQPFKRIQSEREQEEHNIHLRLTATSHRSAFQPLSDMAAVNVGLGQIMTTSSDPQAQETINRLQEEMRKVYGSYSELRVKFEQLSKDYISSQV